MNNIFKSKYTQASTLYVILGIFPSAINFLLLPLYLKYLDVSDYGLLVLINLYAGLFNVFGCLQLNIAANTQYFAKGLDRENYRKGVLYATFFISTVMFFIFSALGGVFFSFYKTDFSFYPLGFIGLVSATLTVWHTLMLVFLKNEYRLKEFGLFSIALTILGIGFQSYFIIDLQWGLSGILYGTLASKIIIIPFLIYYFRKWLILHVKSIKDPLKYGLMALKFSVPFLPAIFIHWIQTLGDRFILERFVSIDKVGQYAVILALLTFPQVVVTAVMNAFKPKLLQLLNDEKHLLIQKAEFLFINFIVLSLVFVLFLGTHLDWITDNNKYIDINQYLFLGVLSILPSSILYMHHLKLMQVEKAGDISKYAFYALITQILLLFLLVPEYGISGALLSFGLSGLLNYILSANRSYSIHQYPVYKILQPAIAFIILSLAGVALIHFSTLDIKIVAEMVGLFTLILLSVILRKEIQQTYNTIISSK
ncbi:MAG: O-antigen/teichoic acid export membrane protein [Marinoscillum sp.]|jgi:O-antigen/teichoic acid export membrane protein